jgi:accessory gene regulator protein AgrB
MVDRHIEKMIATLREKAQHEKESLTKTQLGVHFLSEGCS